MNKEVKVKYTTTRYPQKIVFGVWPSWADWVKFIRSEEKKGHYLEFLMSYEGVKDCGTNPVLKVVNIHPYGSGNTTEDWEDEYAGE